MIKVILQKHQSNGEVSFHLCNNLESKYHGYKLTEESSGYVYYNAEKSERKYVSDLQKTFVNDVQKAKATDDIHICLFVPSARRSEDADTLIVQDESFISKLLSNLYASDITCDLFIGDENGIVIGETITNMNPKTILVTQHGDTTVSYSWSGNKVGHILRYDEKEAEYITHSDFINDIKSCKEQIHMYIGDVYLLGLLALLPLIDLD